MERKTSSLPLCVCVLIGVIIQRRRHEGGAPTMLVAVLLPTVLSGLLHLSISGHRHHCLDALLTRSGMSPRCCESPLLSEEAESAAVQCCEQWIQEHVIRIGLCPYASKPFVENKIRYAVSEAQTDEELVADFFAEGKLLLDAPPDELATTMLVAPLYPEGIKGFYWLYEWLTDTLEAEGETELNNGVQPAFFHPDWSFNGVPAESALHFEKRAPMPVINLLRRADLDTVVEQGLARGVIVNRDIAEHNAAALEAEGFDALARLFNERLAPRHFSGS
jgi:hypothetical protein